MMVTFISQCDKKAVTKTRRVLDSFANRIGDRTWQTVITEEGLQAVKKLLRKTASKNTAVSCHWIRSRSRSELVWIIGSRDKFSSEGYVPVHYTEKDLMMQKWEDDWYYLPLIKSLVRVAGLFHDFGKSNDFFQKKLKSNKNIGDPLRHEWISILFFVTFINEESDDKWIDRLYSGEINLKDKIDILKDIKSPFKKLSPLASFIVWLILSHHRLPNPIEKVYADKNVADFKTLLSVIRQDWSYENSHKEEDLEKLYSFSNGLPTDSDKWVKEVKKAGRKLKECLPLLEKSLENGTWRLILHYSRLSLMLGDHFYSSLDADDKWNTKLKLYANSKNGFGHKKVYSQKLDEHLIGVTKKAVRTAHLLPAFESKKDELQSVYDVKILKQKSPHKYRWQDKAVNSITKWREDVSNSIDSDHFGFFAVNMASTGMGKTFANAKVMRSLSPNGDSLRYILALGLRTLTLQTGEEYRTRLKLGTDELAVLIGSKAVQDLYEKNRKDDDSSDEEFFDNEIFFDSDIPEGELKTVIETTKHRKFLYAPVLTCTIDHLMSATETIRGGRYILPTLRLMSSDLVIDEIDDFDGEDLVAIGRFIHLAGMLGRKVMISSATIPPDLAEGYFNAYSEGWSIFAELRGKNKSVGCAWIDEFTTHTETVVPGNESVSQYRELHQKFTDKRITKLKKQPIKRKVDIKYCNKDDSYFENIKEAIEVKHRDHNIVDDISGKKVSFGVVRTANINPCVELTRFLLNAQWNKDTDIKAMAYHSRQVLIMRSEQEKHLDEVLKTNGKSHLNHPLIREYIDKSNNDNLIFILVTTPVEEVGRDHDFDWAVIEPSSFRSVIQLAGRVLRHRDCEKDIETPNITLMQYNLRAFMGKKPAFKWPGYETDKNTLQTYDLTKLLDINLLGNGLDATYRVSRETILDPENSLIDLEHHTIHELLTKYTEKGAKYLQGWIGGHWWLTALPQRYIRFRRSSPSETMFLNIVDNEYKLSVKDPRTGKLEIQEVFYGIEQDNHLSGNEENNLWIKRDYKELIEGMGEEKLEKLVGKYGEINLPTYNDNMKFVYSNQFGLIIKK